MAISLLGTSTLTISRDDGAGFYDAKGRWVSDPTTDFTILASVQPFKMDNVQTVLPEGRTAAEARTIYTKTELNTAEQFGKTLADTTVIRGKKFFAFAVEPWDSFGLTADHQKVVFLREDQSTNGGL